MTIQDPISDMLTRIRNAQMVSKPMVSMHHSKAKEAIAKVLKSEGYIQDYRIESDAVHQRLVIDLKYHRGKPVIASIERVSKPSLRIYRSKDALPRVLNGLGISIISTSRGVMSDQQARALNLGGEVLCCVS